MWLSTCNCRTTDMEKCKMSIIFARTLTQIWSWLNINFISYFYLYEEKGKGRVNTLEHCECDFDAWQVPGWGSVTSSGVEPAHSLVRPPVTRQFNLDSAVFSGREKPFYLGTSNILEQLPQQRVSFAEFLRNTAHQRLKTKPCSRGVGEISGRGQCLSGWESSNPMKHGQRELLVSGPMPTEVVVSQL